MIEYIDRNDDDVIKLTGYAACESDDINEVQRYEDGLISSVSDKTGKGFVLLTLDADGETYTVYAADKPIKQ
jgi:hypothetical protein